MNIKKRFLCTAMLCKMLTVLNCYNNAAVRIQKLRSGCLEPLDKAWILAKSHIEEQKIFFFLPNMH